VSAGALSTQVTVSSSDLDADQRLRAADPRPNVGAVQRSGLDRSGRRSGDRAGLDGTRLDRDAEQIVSYPADRERLDQLARLNDRGRTGGERADLAE
jgi:hypothetical protein